MEALQLQPSIMKNFIHPEDAPYIDLYSKVLLSDGIEQHEYRIITPSGRLKWLQEQKQIVKNEFGEIIRLDFLITEITERKTEALKLIDSEKTFSNLFYKNPQPMWVFDLESLTFLLVNESAIRFYGYTSDEFTRMTIKQIRPKEDIALLIDTLKNNEKADGKASFWRHLKKNGDLVNVRIIASDITFQGKNARIVLATEVSTKIEKRL